MTTDPDLNVPPGFEPLMNEAVRRILAGEALDPFCAWYCAELTALPAAEHALDAQGRDTEERRAHAMARSLWQSVPVPSNHWRARALPKPERNAPCFCGSGRKYKQCCAEFAAAELPMPREEMLVFALSQVDPSTLDAKSLRELPAEALGIAAQGWNEEGEYERTAKTLAPLFEQPDRLSDRHANAFDALMDALLETGRNSQRRAIAERVATSRDKVLAVTARCRVATMLVDHGDEEGAWQAFQQAQRLRPDDPEVWQLELTLLHAQGRAEEARLRGGVLSTKARRAGLDDLAAHLQAFGEEGFAYAGESGDDDELDPEDEEWVELCEQSPDLLDEDECLALYTVVRESAQDPAQPPVALIAPGRDLEMLQQQWSRRFAVSRPILTECFSGNASGLLEQLPQVREFMSEHPHAWFAVEVLDDILLAGNDLGGPHAPSAVLHAMSRVAEHGVALLEFLIGRETARLEWRDMGSRPWLRLIAQAISVAELLGDTARVERLAAWGIELNPEDNHGWRMVLVPLWLSEGRTDEALALMDRYPDDMPPMEHLRALALFAQGKREEAEATLRAAHDAFPRIIQFLLPDTIDAPAPEGGPGVTVGGDEEAWEHRMRMRGVWMRTGALEWVRGLGLKAPAPAKPSSRRRKETSAPATRTRQIGEYGAEDERHLRGRFGDFARLHGLLTAVAWSPDMVMPGKWLPMLEPLRANPPASLEDANAELAALMSLYNSLVTPLMATDTRPTFPFDKTVRAVANEERDVFAWASGFVQGAELAAAGWRRVGRAIRSDSGSGPFAALLRLAARAPALPGWRARSDSGQALLQELAPEPPQDVLRLALEDLWPAVTKERQGHRR
ncbi:MAG TPA: UPF0149 family protein [Ramlibacter sp.]|uniref:UPF0149 family protein n=1 Tax=Ramlibacter sp. TaxID=1917967 RepID=UPI002BAF0A14|nr:UPF0149 family protein [Ramlibacter sp.]HVZ45590.1 UPF0149 family protein [Ramlibacter sp.]